jgi:hypothetical protein
MVVALLPLFALLICLLIMKIFYDRLKSIESILKDIREKIK